MKKLTPPLIELLMMPCLGFDDGKNSPLPNPKVGSHTVRQTRSILPNIEKFSKVAA